jgi:hypothetical protein
MTHDTAASPAEQPEPDAAGSPELDRTAVDVDGVDIAPDQTLAAKRRASLAARRKTIAATMVYPGSGRAKPKATGQSGDADAAPDKCRAARKPAPKRKAKNLSRAQLVHRLANAVAGELDLIEQVTAGAQVDASLRTESDRRARTLATLARTLSALRKSRENDDQRPAHDDDRPRDLDELRRRLSERLAEKIRGGSALPADGHVRGRSRLPE